MILLAGRIAEEIFYGVSVTTGAINDFEEAYKLADKMITYYGLGERVIYPSNSERYKEMIDDEISTLIEDAYKYAEFIIQNSKDFILEGAELLKEKKCIKVEELIELMNTKYSHISDMIHK
jgi:cell division protease FtsH